MLVKRPSCPTVSSNAEDCSVLIVSSMPLELLMTGQWRDVDLSLPEIPWLYSRKAQHRDVCNI